jgi:hypothetical protein
MSQNDSGIEELRVIVEVHVRGPLDDLELLLVWGPGVKLLAVPTRTCLFTGDNQQRLGEKRTRQSDVR